MVTFDRRWLPLNALRAFDAVGRHLSFTAAANALNVSQSAVSRHVIGLEELLGQKLFERKPQSLALTKAGGALLPIVRGSFDRIEQALNDVVRGGGGLRTLRLQLPPSFAQKLALPILQGFRKEFPDIFVDFSSVGITGAPRTETDVAVIFDRPRTGVAVSDLLWMSRLAPACSQNAPPVRGGKRAAALQAGGRVARHDLGGFFAPLRSGHRYQPRARLRYGGTRGAVCGERRGCGAAGRGFICAGHCVGRAGDALRGEV
jgi:LysR family glycine cleavage system transcriptional activator